MLVCCEPWSMMQFTYLGKKPALPTGALPAKLAGVTCGPCFPVWDRYWRGHDHCKLA